MSKTARPEAYTSLQAGIGERIAWVRELVGLGQSELAHIMGIDQSTLNKIEKGDRAPNIFYVIEIANRLRVSTDYILRGLLTARTDEELGLNLAAAHPELVHRMQRRDEGMGTAQANGRPPLSKTVAQAGYIASVSFSAASLII